MAVNAKSVVDIEVNEQQFKRFQDAFAKYSKMLAQTPKDWKNVTAEQRAAMENMSRMTAAMTAQASLGRQIVAHHKDVAVHARDSVVSWGKLREHAKSFAIHIKDASLGFMRWAGISGAVGGGGLLFGLDKLADAIRGTRATRAGLGMAPGQIESLRIGLGGTGMNVEGLMDAFAGAQADIGSPAYIGMRALGLNPEAGAFQNIRGLNRALKSKFGGVNKGMWAGQLEAMGLSGVLSTQDVQRAVGMSDADITKQEQSVTAGVGKYGIREGAEKAWSEFKDALEDVTGRLRKLIAEGLTPLLPALEHFAEVFVKKIGEWVQRPEFKEFMEKLPDYIEKFAKGLFEAGKAIYEFIARFTGAPGTPPAAPTSTPDLLRSNPGFMPTTEEMPGWQRDRINKRRYDAYQRESMKLGINPMPYQDWLASGQPSSSSGGTTGAYQEGGVVPHDMDARVHEGEIVASPEKILQVIKQFESSGNYGILGANVPGQGRALGAYQLMPGTLATMSRRVLGRTVSPQEYLSNPGMQDQIASAMVNEYLNKYHTSRDVFSMWASGQPYSVSSRWADKVSGVSVAQMVAQRERALGGNMYAGGAPAGGAGVTINDATGGSVVASLEQAAFAPPPFPL